MSELIIKTEAFLKETFENSLYFQQHVSEMNYRLEHSYRVANIAKSIAKAEGLNPVYAVITGLLHDIAYCEEMTTREEQLNHGRRSGEISRPFLISLGLNDSDVNEICYAIAIHVDDKADFEWNRSAFSETVGDADNLDRFDVYRIYETLQYNNFSEMPLSEKTDYVSSMIKKLIGLKDFKLGTKTAQKLWSERINYYIEFYNKLISQLNNSNTIH